MWVPAVGLGMGVDGEDVFSEADVGARGGEGDLPSLVEGNVLVAVALQGHGEAVGLALLDQFGGFEHHVGSEEVESPDTVVGAPSSPVGYGSLSHGIASGASV